MRPTESFLGIHLWIALNNGNRLKAHVKIFTIIWINYLILGRIILVWIKLYYLLDISKNHTNYANWLVVPGKRRSSSMTVEEITIILLGMNCHMLYVATFRNVQL